ncbi:MAG: hypothetical protein QM779_12090 [Propionicimonas sp.]|uniref:hypothetical protein n=1 Tax=Propionicimonas sp. TaxID=1955623 RepID=UPI003D095C78
MNRFASVTTWGLAAATVVATAVVAGPPVVGRMLHPRDVDAYQNYVATYMLNPGTAADLAWARAHPAEVLAEGDRACEWLSRRPSAPRIDPSGDSEVFVLTKRYLRTTRETTVLPLTKEGRRRLVSGAWAYLCWSEREDRSAPISDEDD